MSPEIVASMVANYLRCRLFTYPDFEFRSTKGSSIPLSGMVTALCAAVITVQLINERGLKIHPWAYRPWFS